MEPKNKPMSQEEFVDDIFNIMKKQEEENPALKRISARADSSWNEVWRLVQSMIREKDDEKEAALITQIASQGEKAIYPLIEALLAFKEMEKKFKKPLQEVILNKKKNG